MVPADRPTRPSELVLNGERLDWAAGCERLSGMVAPAVVTRAGGLLFKAGSEPGALQLLVRPWFVDGQRTYHYDMILPDAADPTLAGDLTSSGRLALLFGPDVEDLAALRGLCVALAAALLDAGLEPTLPLEAVSRQALHEVGLVDQPPATLGELARL
jgi:hypothetical protein